MNLNILRSAMIWFGCPTPKLYGCRWFGFCCLAAYGLARHYNVSAWKVATLDSVLWRNVQSLNSRFEILCACALLLCWDQHMWYRNVLCIGYLWATAKWCQMVLFYFCFLYLCLAYMNRFPVGVTYLLRTKKWISWAPQADE